jgi:cell fate (sporulation/competence/biofilm development) regulator YlbF (YheA/YmcA/DUF963 family)
MNKQELIEITSKLQDIYDNLILGNSKAFFHAMKQLSLIIDEINDII